MKKLKTLKNIPWEEHPAGFGALVTRVYLKEGGFVSVVWIQPEVPSTLLKPYEVWYQPAGGYWQGDPDKCLTEKEVVEFINSKGEVKVD